MLKKKMMKRKTLFVTCLILGLMICLPAEAIIITLSNVVIPTLAGDTFSFDLIIEDDMGVAAQAFKSTISVSSSGLTFGQTASEDVGSDLGYWIYGNSAGASAIDKGSNSYEFADGPDNGAAEALFAGDIMARYSFVWDGTVGDYTFDLDFDTTKSYVLTDAWEIQALEFTSGQYEGDDSSFTVTIIPEPATLTLMCLGAAVLRRKRLFP